MEPIILDTSFKEIGMLDSYISFIWTDRYAEYGDFQIYLDANQENLELLKENYYLYLKGSDHIMIIEDIQIDTDLEEGDHMTVTGRSLESILDRRIVWDLTTLTGNLQNGIKKLLTENIISPSVTNRKIDNFIFSASTDTAITNLTVSNEYLGDSLYDVISSLCFVNNIGFKITLNASNQFVFQLYSGKDRSYNQQANPHIIFSHTFENLINTNYIESNRTLKTVTRIWGEQDKEITTTDDQGVETIEYVTETVFTTKAASGGELSGINRREIFTDASAISSQKEDGTYMTDSEFIKILQQEGEVLLSEYTETKAFDGEIDATGLFVYGRDFFMGDVVQVANEFGKESTSRVVELIRSQDENGYSEYPTFSAIN